MIRHVRFALLPVLPLVCILGAPRNTLAMPGKPPVKRTKNLVSSETQPTEVSYGIFIANQRVGYVAGTRKIAVRNSQKAVYFTLTVRIKVASYQYVENDIGWKTLSDKPLERQTDTTEGGKTTREHRIYRNNQVTIETSKPGEPVRRRTLSVVAFEKEEAESRRDSPLSSLQLVIPRSWKTLDSEVVTIAFQPVKAYRVQPPQGKPNVSTPTVWMDKERNLLRVDFMTDNVATRFERMPLRAAMASLSAERVPTTVASDKVLPMPRALRAARYQVTGLIAVPDIADDDVQTMTIEKTPTGTYNALVSVATAPAESAPAVAIADVPRERFALFLRSGSATPAQSAEALRLARNIIGGETNTARAVQRLSRWVYDNIRYDWEFSGARTEAQTLHDRRGVCQNYATLLVALSRAVGIPAKYCAGPTYDDGKYIFHAWAECWVGKWVAFEPTWGVPFADAARLKLSEGEADTPLTVWNVAAPPQITYLAANETPTITALQSVEALKMSEEALMKAVISRITTAARPGKEVPVVTINDALPTTYQIVSALPFGTTADYRPPGFAKTDGPTSDAALPSIEFVLPDNRKCLLVDTVRKTLLTPEAATVRSFEISNDGGKTWSRATVSELHRLSDKELVDLIQKGAQVTTAPMRLITFHPSSPSRILPLLPNGSTAKPIAFVGVRTPNGSPLPSYLYQLPGGKKCLVVEMSLSQ